MKRLIRNLVTLDPRVFRAVKLYRRKHLAKAGGYPNWSKIIDRNALEWRRTIEKSKLGPRVLVATGMGSNLPATTLESVVSAALALRGANPEILLCDSILDACQEAHTEWYPNLKQFVQDGPRRDLCHYCFKPAEKMFVGLGFKVHRISSYLTDDDKNEIERELAQLDLRNIKDYQYQGLALGEHSLAGALRFFARADLAGEKLGDDILKRYIRAGLQTAISVRRLVRARKFETSVFNHGIYIPQGIIGEVLRQEGVRVVNWNAGYKKKTFIFSHHETYHHTMMSEPVKKWEDIELGEASNHELQKYLKSRWQGTEDWIWFHERPRFDLSSIEKTLGIDFSKPTIGLLTSVLWDAQLHYPSNAFKNMVHWIVETIRYFENRPDLQLLVRIHPAEIHGTLKSRQPLVAEINKAFPILPKNVFIIPPESDISTYMAMSQCNSVIIYNTKTGVELTSMGIPVIVAGEAWIRNKGITQDASSFEEYINILDSLPNSGAMAESLRLRAQKYAFHFFFRRMIPLRALEPSLKKWPPYELAIETIDELNPGKCSGLDIICDGILKGSDFIYPAEKGMESHTGAVILESISRNSSH